MASETGTIGGQLDRIQRIALIAGVVGIVLLVVGAVFDLTQFFQSYLYAYMFWFAFSLGPLAALMVQFLTGGKWGLVIRRPAEAAALTLPLMALLFIPIIVGIPQLYSWADPEVIANDPIVAFKTPYLNVPFFIGRAVLYFAIWIGLAYLYSRWSDRQDRENDLIYTGRMRAISGPGIILYVLTLTFAVTDWVMSLEPHWYSTILGVIFLVGQALVTLALMIFILRLFGDKPPLSRVAGIDRIHDLGKLLFVATVFWAYTGYAQYVITWAGNLQEFTPWYLHRISGGWQWLAYLLILGQFIVPFFLLLSRRFKRQIRILVLIAAYIVLMRFLDVYWLIQPAFHPDEFHISWVDFAAVLAIGGLYVALFARNLKSKPLLPAVDQRMGEAERAAQRGSPGAAGVQGSHVH